jgi:hypothetical protein
MRESTRCLPYTDLDTSRGPERAARGEGVYGGLARFGRERRAFIEAVRREVETRGPLSAGELEDGGKGRGSWWDWKPAKLVLEETGLLPHLNPGVMSAEDLALLRPVSASMGLMLETASDRLAARGLPARWLWDLPIAIWDVGADLIAEQAAALYDPAQMTGVALEPPDAAHPDPVVRPGRPAGDRQQEDDNDHAA